MRIHANAKLTPKMRMWLVRRVTSDGVSVTRAASDLGVSRQTAHKWLRRYRQEGEPGLLDRSSRPHESPRMTDPARERLAASLRRIGMTHEQISSVAGISPRTASRACTRQGVRSSRVIDPRPANRYERRHPGEMIHLDVKKLGRIERAGHRFHGERGARTRGAGWEYVHVAIDDHTRIAYAQVLADETAETTVGFLERMRAFFGAHGVDVHEVMTDNGGNYVSRAFHEALVAAGIRHIRTRPYTPRTNGKAGRFIRTLLAEWAYVRPYGHSRERTAVLRNFLRWYNHQRPHGGLNRQTPIGRLAAADDNNVLTGYT